MYRLSAVFRSLALLVCAAGLAACAAGGQASQAEPEPWVLETQEDVEALKRAVDASYERERALGEEMKRVEADNTRLRQEIETLAAQLGAVQAQVDSLPMEVSADPKGRSVATPLDVQELYDQAQAHYRRYRYEPALELFEKALQADPYGKWADNAQYWKGECYYGLGRYSQALTEFTKVFAYPKTEKGDDAQLKIGRCYQVQGEDARARAAYQKLIDEFPDSEYAGTARKALQKL